MNSEVSSAKDSVTIWPTRQTQRPKRGRSSRQTTIRPITFHRKPFLPAKPKENDTSSTRTNLSSPLLDSGSVTLSSQKEKKSEKENLLKQNAANIQKPNVSSKNRKESHLLSPLPTDQTPSSTSPVVNSQFENPSQPSQSIESSSSQRVPETSSSDKSHKISKPPGSEILHEISESSSLRKSHRVPESSSSEKLHHKIPERSSSGKSQEIPEPSSSGKLHRDPKQSSSRKNTLLKTVPSNSLNRSTSHHTDLPETSTYSTRRLRSQTENADNDAELPENVNSDTVGPLSEGTVAGKTKSIRTKRQARNVPALLRSGSSSSTPDRIPNETFNPQTKSHKTSRNREEWASTSVRTPINETMGMTFVSPRSGPIQRKPKGSKKLVPRRQSERVISDIKVKMWSGGGRKRKAVDIMDLDTSLDAVDNIASKYMEHLDNVVCRKAITAFCNGIREDLTETIEKAIRMKREKFVLLKTRHTLNRSRDDLFELYQTSSRLSGEVEKLEEGKKTIENEQQNMEDLNAFVKNIGDLNQKYSQAKLPKKQDYVMLPNDDK